MIHAFNDRGFDALAPKWNGGTPNKINEQIRDWICVIARCDPRFLGQPFSCWSLPKLRDYLIAAGHVNAINVETVRRILHERGVTWQTSKTWKARNDPTSRPRCAAYRISTIIRPPTAACLRRRVRPAQSAAATRQGLEAAG